MLRGTPRRRAASALLPPRFQQCFRKVRLAWFCAAPTVITGGLRGGRPRRLAPAADRAPGIGRGGSSPNRGDAAAPAWAASGRSVSVERISLGQHDRPLDGVLQLADVARPG